MRSECLLKGSWQGEEESRLNPLSWILGTEMNKIEEHAVETDYLHTYYPYPSF